MYFFQNKNTAYSIHKFLLGLFFGMAFVSVSHPSQLLADTGPQTTNYPPMITLIGSNPVSVFVGETFTDPGAMALDVQDGDISQKIVVTGSVNTAVAGTYAIHYNVKNSQGLAAPEIIRTVKVCPLNTPPLPPPPPTPTNTAPVITLIGNPSMTIMQGSSFTDPGATAFDQEDGDITSKIVVTGTVSTTTVGTYTIHYNVKDSQGLAAEEKTRAVTVTPTVTPPIPSVCSAPQITSTTNVSATAGSAFSYTLSASSTEPLTFSIATSTLPGTLTLNGNVVSGTITTAGTYTVQMMATNTCGNASQTISITVNPSSPVTPINHAPVITLIGATSTSITVGTVFIDPGATAFDQEDGDITSKIVVTGTVSTTTVGTYTIHYNVKDSQGLAAEEKTRAVVVNAINATTTPPQCSDGIDNDGDGKIDAADPGCHSDGNPNNPGSYTPNGNSENSAPIITLIGNETMHITVGNTFTDPGATAFDEEDGDITSKIIVTGSVATGTVGTYIIHYNVKDSQGLAATEKIRTVVVDASSVGSTGGGGGGGGGYTGGGSSSGGGGGGGGGSVILPTLVITNEKLENSSSTDTAIISWNTSIPADSRVVYGKDPVLAFPEGDTQYGYTATTATTSELTMFHTIIISKLSLDSIKYYFRPVSHAGSLVATGKELSNEITKKEVVSPASCFYLRDFLKRGQANDVNEVKKLQAFLNSFDGENLAIDGFFGQSTFDAVSSFQTKYHVDVLNPWGYGDADPTGYVYLTTRKKVNEIYCRSAFPLDASQNAEVAAFRKLLQSVKENNITLPLVQASKTEGTASASSLSASVTGVSTSTSIQSGLGTSTNIAAAGVTNRSALRNFLAGAYVAFSKTVAWRSIFSLLFFGLIIWAFFAIRKHSQKEADALSVIPLVPIKNKEKEDATAPPVPEK